MSDDRLSKGYAPDFDLDAAFGHQGELFVAGLIDGLGEGLVEVKRDAKAVIYKNAFVEYECKHGGVWRPSGIATTTSDYWFHLLGPKLRLAVVLPVIDLRVMVDDAIAAGRTAPAMLGATPGRGALIPLSDFLLGALSVGERAA